jgi:hypothetical protein
MKIKSIRVITDADKKKVPAGCSSTTGGSPDKPPC